MCGYVAVGPDIAAASLRSTPLSFPPQDADLQEFLTERRRSLSKQIRLRLAQSVTEGELPQNSNCEVLASLCLTVLSGLTFRILEGSAAGLLFRSLELFVSVLGFAPEDKEKL
jgi:hypothetical protein